MQPDCLRGRYQALVSTVAAKAGHCSSSSSSSRRQQQHAIAAAAAAVCHLCCVSSMGKKPAKDAWDSWGKLVLQLFLDRASLKHCIFVASPCKQLVAVHDLGFKPSTCCC
jgi:hypothetical protein